MGRFAELPSRAVVLLATAAVCACTPPEPPARYIQRRSDSVAAAEARAREPEWRAARYPTLSLNGPFNRPKLPESSDTNDPVAYYRLGDSVRWQFQGLADRAFYWATRLDPTMAEAYFARWDLRRHGTSYRLSNDGAVHRISPRSPNDFAGVDSLLLNALVYNPFLDGSLDIPPLVARLSERQAARDPRTAGAWAYARGDYRRAVREWGDAIHRSDENASLRIPRAYAWVHLDESDSAAAELTAFIQRLERIQDSSIAPYFSKDFLYYAIGILRAGQKKYSEAKTAYESALLENLGFYMAHVRLSAVDLILQDTATALSELETASLLRADDPMLLSLRASILLNAGRTQEAEQQLHAAIRADSDFALPHAFLGKAAEQRQDSVAARAAYRAYLDRASRSAPERAWVEDHLAGLTAPHPDTDKVNQRGRRGT
jgi:hypothetical protein